MSLGWNAGGGEGHGLLRCLPGRPSNPFFAGESVCIGKPTFWAHEFGAQMAPELTEAQHTDRTCRHMGKYFAFLLRHYLSLSHLIAVIGSMLASLRKSK